MASLVAVQHRHRQCQQHHHDHLSERACQTARARSIACTCASREVVAGKKAGEVGRGRNPSDSRSSNTKQSFSPSPWVWICFFHGMRFAQLFTFSHGPMQRCSITTVTQDCFYSLKSMQMKATHTNHCKSMPLKITNVITQLKPIMQLNANQRCNNYTTYLTSFTIFRCWSVPTILYGRATHIGAHPHP